MEIKKFLVAHRVKLIVGAPIIVLLLLNSSGVILGNTIIISSASVFAESGSEVVISVNVNARTPVNAIGGTMHFFPEELGLLSVIRRDSVIDLWSEEPSVSSSTISWSGGLLNDKAQNGINGNILTAHFRAIKTGKTTLAITDGQLLASDGAGTNVYAQGKPLAVIVYEKGGASPDVNGDGALTIADVNSLYLKTFAAYDKRYDENGDGRLDWSDVKFLIALF